MIRVFNDPLIGLYSTVSDDITTTSFDINVYDLFSAFQGFIDHLRPANDFLATLSIDERKAIEEMFVSAKRILRPMKNDLVNGATYIAVVSNLINDVFNKLSLTQRITNFVVYNPQIKLPTSTLPEGSSFTRSDWHQVTALAIATKIMFPIFGEILHIAIDEDSDVVMRHIVDVNTMMIICFRDIIDSLKYYISAVVLKTSSENPEMDLSWSDVQRISEICYAVFIVKYLPYSNLYGDMSNIGWCIEEWIPELMTTEDF